MKSVFYHFHTTVLPEVGDFIDVDGQGHTGEAEVIEVLPGSEIDPTTQITVRLRFLEPFSNGLYLGVGYAAAHPAYIDLSYNFPNPEEPDASMAGSIIWY